MVRTGYRAGRNRGYEAGYAQGYAAGSAKGRLRYEQIFPGTSIIIPTFNQCALLRQCLRSIGTYTNQPVEVIVVDNASTDGTRDYLRRLKGKVIAVRNDANRGFSGAVNRGLLLARGETLVVLNDDTIVTSNWLDNLLNCLQSDERIGLVGPVANYISGSQQIDVAYRSMAEMQSFAANHNRQDASRWRETDRLAGFCLAMTRATFQRLGYFDEGFVIGNCEDDDYGLRARICGMKLMIAGDAFIHHVGSATVKRFGARFAKIYQHNLAYFSAKWENFDELENSLPIAKAKLRMVDFYPSCAFVRGPDGAVHWLECGIRRKLANEDASDAARVSAVDLRMLPEGPPITRDEADMRLQEPISIERLAEAEGAMVRTPDGTTWQISGGMLRKVTVPLAFAAWKLQSRPIFPLDSETAAGLPRGNPILPPIALQAPDL